MFHFSYLVIRNSIMICFFVFANRSLCCNAQCDAPNHVLAVLYDEYCRDFASMISRPFELRYNPYTQSVEVLDNEQLIASAVSEIKGDLSKICAALKRLK